LASTAGPVCFFKEPLPDWNIRFRGGWGRELLSDAMKC
jgi:hypothetical protein